MSMPSDEPRPIIPIVRHDRRDDVTDRLPPQNLDAERCVLGAILLENEVLEEVADLVQPEHFYREAHQVFYRAILKMRDEGKAIDAVTLPDELDRDGVFDRIGGDELLGEIANSVPHAANVKYHASIVRQKAALRAYIQSRSEEIRAGYSNLHTTKELLNLATNNLVTLEAIVQEEEVDDSTLLNWPDQPNEAIWHGVAGQLVQAISPHSEADPVAILGQFLVAISNAFGRNPHWYFESTRHSLNLFTCVVGDSGRARKGTSWEHCLRVLHAVDDDWADNRITSGLSTGEGLIHQIRDPLFKRVKVDGGYEEREIDEGVRDKRVLFVESEFGGLLANMSRDGNNTSAVIRQAFDSGNIRISTKNFPSRATGGHVSIIGHITSEELHQRLSGTDAVNGFANRFLWLCARRSKLLPHGGQIHTVDLTPFIQELQDVINFTNNFLDPKKPLRRDAHANQLWEHVYPDLTTPKPGRLGAVTSRAEAITMRLAGIYAVLDRVIQIGEKHLLAALALWRYGEQSAAWIFGESLGDPDAEAVLKAMKAAGPEGLTRTQINRRVFHGKMRGDDLTKILSKLVHSALISPPKKAESPNASSRPNKWTLKTENIPKPSRLARAAGSDDATASDDGACG